MPKPFPCDRCAQPIGTYTYHATALEARTLDHRHVRLCADCGEALFAFLAPLPVPTPDPRPPLPEV